MTLLSGSVQPSLLTLLSSTSQPGLSPLFKAVTDSSLPADSIITVIPDHTTGSSSSGSQRQKVIPKHAEKGSLAHQIIHIQSPNIKNTYIQAGSSLISYSSSRDKGKQREEIQVPLGVEIPWIGLHIKRLGRREMSFEVGVVDARGREGIIRFSSFKKTPSIHPHRSPPLIHLPFSTPTKSASTLTPWLHTSVDLSRLLPLFTSLPRTVHDGEHGGSRKRRKVAEMPSTQFGSVSYVRIYANCRVRRIWFAEHGERTLEGTDRAGREEWGLYAVDVDEDSVAGV